MKYFGKVVAALFLAVNALASGIYNPGSGSVGSGVTVYPATATASFPFGASFSTTSIGGTFPLLSTSTLQVGATFYVSSGTVNSLTAAGTANFGADTGSGFPMSWDNPNGVLRLGGGTSDPFSWMTINNINGGRGITFNGNGGALENIFITNASPAINHFVNSDVSLTQFFTQNSFDAVTSVLQSGRKGYKISVNPTIGPDSTFIPLMLQAGDQSAPTARTVSIVLRSTGVIVSSSIFLSNPDNSATALLQDLGGHNQSQLSITAPDGIGFGNSPNDAFADVVMYSANSTNATLGIIGLTPKSYIVAVSTSGNGSLPYVMDISTTGHLNSQAVSGSTVTSCGVGASVVGSDIAGTITTGAGSPTACTLTFAKPFTNTPVCLCGANGATACDPTSTSATQVTFTLGFTETTIKYICIGSD